MARIALIYVLLFAGLNLAFIIPSGERNDNKSGTSMITWSEAVPLTWRDFKGKAREWSGVSALTASAIEYSYDCFGDRIELNVKAVFIPEESWVKPDAKTDYILAHEQLHFDITEVYARKLRQKLSAEVRTCHDVWRIDRIADKIIDEWKAVQDQYDKDTHHSINRDLQDKWIARVAYELESYSGFTLELWTRNR